jgi:hypothetical protein
VATAGLSLVLLTACQSGSDALSAPAAPGGDGAAAASSAAAAASSAIAAVAGGSSVGSTSGSCTLVTPQELTAATGVTYTKIVDSGIGTICNVTGASLADSFYYHVDKEDGTITTWAAEIATIKEDDGSETSVSGLGDQAAQGAVKEFAVESKGKIVVVANADVNNPATEKDFTRTKKIEQLLISKL